MDNEQGKEKRVVDILSQMAQDSSANSDQIDKLDDTKLDKVARLANEANSLQEKVSLQEEELKNSKKALRRVTDELLPEALEDLNLEKASNGNYYLPKGTYTIEISGNGKTQTNLFKVK